MLRTKLLLILLIICFIILYCTPWAWSQPVQEQTKSQNKTIKLFKQTASNHENLHIQLITRQELIDDVTSAINTSNEKVKATQDPVPTDNSWWFSLFLVIFTAGLVIVGGVQCFIIFRTLKATTIAAEAAKGSAQAAINTVSTMQAQDRAYIFVRVKIDKTDTSKNENENLNKIPDLVSIVITNHGKTPAILLDIRIIVSIDSPDAPYERVALRISSIPDSASFIPHGTFIIDSGTERVYPERVFITEEQRHKITNLSSTLFCLGRIKYKDIFDNLHETVFGWEYEQFVFFRPIDNPKCNYHT